MLGLGRWPERSAIPPPQAAAGSPDAVSGVCLLNCAGGMNNKSVAEDWRVKLAMPLFLLIDWLLAQPKLARYLFDKFR